MKSPNPLLHRVFLCHSAKDKEFVRRLARDLEMLGISVWFDEAVLTPGDSLHATIGQAIEKSSYMAVVLSPNSVQSKWCKKELNQALSREDRTGRNVVIPIWYRNCQIPPFVEDKLYVDFRRAYFRPLGELAGYLWGLDIGPLRTALGIQRPRTLDHVRLCLNEALQGRKKHLTKSQIDSIVTLLDELQIPIPDDATKMTAMPVLMDAGVTATWVVEKVITKPADLENGRQAKRPRPEK